MRVGQRSSALLRVRQNVSSRHLLKRGVIVSCVLGMPLLMMLLLGVVVHGLLAGRSTLTVAAQSDTELLSRQQGIGLEAVLEAKLFERLQAQRNSTYALGEQRVKRGSMDLVQVFAEAYETSGISVRQRLQLFDGAGKQSGCCSHK